MQKQTWNVNVNGFMYVIEETAKDITINPGGVYKKKEFPRIKAENYSYIELPIQGANITICYDITGKNTLCYDGYDINTHLPYDPPVQPKWSYAFIALYILNFILICGGALGGALNAGGYFLTITAASKKSGSTLTKVLTCVGIYVGFTIIELIIAFAVALTLNR